MAVPPGCARGRTAKTSVAAEALSSVFDLARLRNDRVETLQVLELVPADQLHRVQPLGLEQAQADPLHRHRGLDAGDESVLEVDGERELEFVDPAGARSWPGRA